MFWIRGGSRPCSTTDCICDASRKSSSSPGLGGRRAGDRPRIRQTSRCGRPGGARRRRSASRQGRSRSGRRQGDHDSHRRGQRSGVEDAAEETERVLGPIDVWVNDAMVSVFSPFNEMTAEEFRRVTEVTYLGFVYGTMAALQRMLPRDRGHDRPSRLGAGLSRHSLAIGLLRRQARHSGIHRIGALRVAA